MKLIHRYILYLFQRPAGRPVHLDQHPSEVEKTLNPQPTTTIHQNQWIGLRENLQETIDFPMKLPGVSGFIFPLNQSILKK